MAPVLVARQVAGEQEAVVSVEGEFDLCKDKQLSIAQVALPH